MHKPKFKAALALASAALIAAGCASSPKQKAEHGNKTDVTEEWVATRSDANKAFASQCTVGTVATAINAIGAPLQMMQRNAYDKVDTARANYKGRKIYKAVEGDVAAGATKAEVLSKLTPEQKAEYDKYVKYVKEQDFGERENQLKAMLPKLAQAGVEIGGLVVMAKKDPNFAKLAGLAMITQTRNVSKDADALKKILDDTTKAKDFWAALDAEDKDVQQQTREAEAEVAK